MKTIALFHKAARQGRAISMLRQRHARKGIYITAHRAELKIMLKKLKKLMVKT